MKPFRSKKYLKWVKSLPCSVTGFSADDPHHIIGHQQGGMGTKASDLFTFPVTRDEHNRLHHDFTMWEHVNGPQWIHVINTIILAIDSGEIEMEMVINEINSQVKRPATKSYLLEML